MSSSHFEPRVKKTSTVSDPYAGQYPPPPPLIPQGSSSDQTICPPQQHQEPFYLVDNQRQSFSSSQFHEDAAVSSSHSLPESQRANHYDGNYSANSHHDSIDNDGEYQDPQAVDLKDFLYAEREDKLRQQQQQQLEQALKQQQTYNNIVDDDYRHHHPPPRPETIYYSPLYSNPGNMSSPLPLPPPFMQHTPSFMNQQHTPQFFSSFGPQGSNNPPLIPPMLPQPPPPIMINEKYSNGPDCYCMTCCSCCLTLISVLFLCGGLALIITASVVQGNCSSKAVNGTLCQQIFHDGLLYGGIVITGLAALTVLWLILRCLCYRKN